MLKKRKIKPADVLITLNPRFTKEAINMILKGYISPVNRKLSACKVFCVKVPYLGTFKTHGNKKKQLSAGQKRYFKKYHKRMNKHKFENWTDENLLF